LSVSSLKYFNFVSGLLLRCFGKGASFHEHNSALLLPPSKTGKPLAAAAAAAINMPSSSILCNCSCVYSPSVLVDKAEFNIGTFLVLFGYKLGRVVPLLNYARSSPAAAAQELLYLFD